MLEDADELREQLDGQQTSEALSQAQEQMEQTRENLRNSSEALNQGDTSQALAAGTPRGTGTEGTRRDRTQRICQPVQRVNATDAGRCDSVGASTARVAQPNESAEPEAASGLRGANNKEQVEKTAAQQQADLDELMKKMRSAVESAEEPEPLLAQRLYDTYRTTEQKQTDRKLETTQQLLRSGLNEQAQQLAEQTQTELTSSRRYRQSCGSCLGQRSRFLAHGLRPTTATFQANRSRSQPGNWPTQSIVIWRPAERSATGQGEQQPGQQQPGQGNSQVRTTTRSGQQQPGTTGQQQPGQGNNPQG